MTTTDGESPSTSGFGATETNRFWTMYRCLMAASAWDYETALVEAERALDEAPLGFFGLTIRLQALVALGRHEEAAQRAREALRVVDLPEAAGILRRHHLVAGRETLGYLYGAYELACWNARRAQRERKRWWPFRRRRSEEPERPRGEWPADYADPVSFVRLYRERLQALDPWVSRPKLEVVR